MRKNILIDDGVKSKSRIDTIQRKRDDLSNVRKKVLIKFHHQPPRPPSCSHRLSFFPSSPAVNEVNLTNNYSIFTVYFVENRESNVQPKQKNSHIKNLHFPLETDGEFHELCEKEREERKK